MGLLLLTPQVLAHLLNCSAQLLLRQMAELRLTSAQGFGGAERPHLLRHVEGEKKMPPYPLRLDALPEGGGIYEASDQASLLRPTDPVGRREAH